jgi:hypothetical protein
VTAFRSILSATALVLALAGSSTAQSRSEVSLDDGLAIAREALLDGEPGLARAFALALLEADAKDRAALTIMSAAQTALGNPREGFLAGRRAFRASTTRAQRYEAARLTALAAANQDRLTLARYWLRRAAANAPGAADLDQTRTDFRALRRMDPWSMRAQLSISPSDNVNGGSEVSYNLIDGLPFVGILSGDARALPGVSASANLEFGRRLSQSSDHATRLLGRVNVRRVWLNDEAREILDEAEEIGGRPEEGIDASDFGSTYATATLDHQLTFGPGHVGISMSLGGTWTGGEFDYPFARGALSYHQSVGGSAGVVFKLHYEQQFNPADQSATDGILALSTRFRHQTRSIGTWSLKAGIKDQRSNNLNARNTTYTVQASYRPAQAFGPVVLTFNLGSEVADYYDYAGLGLSSGGAPILVSVGRADRKRFASIEATFDDWSYAGFAPVMTLSGYDTESNVTRYQRNSMSLNLGVRSTF